ncbi:guaA, partial [Symbiodinium sp. CCMP2592]
FPYSPDRLPCWLLGALCAAFLILLLNSVHRDIRLSSPMGCGASAKVHDASFEQVVSNDTLVDLTEKAAMTGTPLLRASTSQHPVRSKSGTPRIPLKLKGKRPVGPLAPPHGSGRFLIEENFPWHQEQAEAYYAKSMARQRIAFDRVLGDATAQPQDDFSNTDVRDSS